MEEDQNAPEFPEVPLFGAPEGPSLQDGGNTGDPESFERFTSHWEWKTSDDVILSNFPEAQVRTKSSGEVKLYELNTHTGYLSPRSGSTPFYEGMKSYGVIRLIISRDGAKLLKAHKEEIESKSIAREDITLYLEDNTGDILSEGVMRVNAGDVAQNRLYSGTSAYDFVNDQQKISRAQFDELLSYTDDSNMLASFVAHMLSSTSSVINFLPGEVAKLIDELVNFTTEKARIEESVWNPESKGYRKNYKKVYKLLEGKLDQLHLKLNGITEDTISMVPDVIKAPLNSLRSIIDAFHSSLDLLAKDLKNQVQFRIALVCGVWNALVDLINGILTLISLLLKAPGAMADTAASNYDQGPYFFSLLEEYMDNFVQSVAAIKWLEVFTELGRNFAQFIISIPEKVQNMSAAQVGYYTGYIAFNIAEFFLPIFKIAKATKAGKLPEAFAQMVEDIHKAAQNIARAGQKVGKAVRKAPKQAFDIFFDLLENLSILLRQGTTALKEFIQMVFEKLKVWLNAAVGIITSQMFIYGSWRQVSMTILGFEIMAKLLSIQLARRMNGIGLKLAQIDKGYVLLFKGEVIMVDKISRINSILSKVFTKSGRKLLAEFDDMVLASGKYVYGTTKASRLAIKYRKTLNAPNHPGNIAIFDFIDISGKRRVKEFTTLAHMDEYIKAGYYEKVHAEKLGIDWLRSRGIPVKNVKSIYSELAPCSFKGHQCQKLLKKNFPDAKVEYSFDYPGVLDDHLEPIRQASIKDRNSNLKNILK